MILVIARSVKSATKQSTSEHNTTAILVIASPRSGRGEEQSDVATPWAAYGDCFATLAMTGGSG